MEENKLTHTVQLIVIGGSAGSLHVILQLLSQLKKNFDIPVLIALHRNSSFESGLTELISVKTNLAVKEVEEKEQILPGHVYLCPADYHVLIEKDGSFSLDYSEKIHYSRPSIDVSFKSAADAYAPQLLCILLSGANADGAEGTNYAELKGATVIIQDPEEAPVAYMPLQALKQLKKALVLNTPQIVQYINIL